METTMSHRPLSGAGEFAVFTISALLGVVAAIGIIGALFADNVGYAPTRAELITVAKHYAGR
jgi:hypothetical protein